MKRYFKIGNREISELHDPLVIAEIGINHNGSLSIAKKMIDAAHRAGVEVIKHQTHIVEDEMSASAKKVIPGNADISIYEIMAQCSLDEEEEREMKDYVENKGMIFISTPFSRAAADRLEAMNVPGYKIGSGECNNFPLLEHIAAFKKPVILSTGMNGLETIRKAITIFEKYKTPVALLHTTNLYPTPNHLVRLGAMQQLMEEFPENVVGLSDHTISNHACLAAIALGGLILERHFTDHMNRKGPDIVCSMDEDACKDLIESSKKVKSMLGGEKNAAEEEKVTSEFAFATVVAIKEIKKGEKLTKDNIWVKRPGTGEIIAEDYNKVLGKVALKDIAYDTHLKWDQVSS